MEWEFLSESLINVTCNVEGVSSQTVESNLALREGRTDILDILRHLDIFRKT